MARSNFPGKKISVTPQQIKAKLDKNLGVYIFIDEDGNVTQIKKKKKSITKYYPNEPSNVENIVGDYLIIGIDGGIPQPGGGPLNPDGSTVGATTSMGIGDNVEAYARYV